MPTTTGDMFTSTSLILAAPVGAGIVVEEVVVVEVVAEDDVDAEADLGDGGGPCRTMAATGMACSMIPVDCRMIGLALRTLGGGCEKSIIMSDMACWAWLR